MPTFDTPNSQHSYTVPDNAAGVKVTVIGGAGGAGGFGGASGGAGGEVTAEVSANTLGGRNLTVYVGEAGQAPPDGFDSGPGGSVPYNNLSGVDGGSASGGGGGGGGGAPSLLVGPAGIAAIGEGGGGGGGSDNNNTIADPGGGGGGARGGAGAAGDGGNGQDGDGTGFGGDGGIGDVVGSDPGDPGGTDTISGATVVNTTTSTAGPSVTVEPLYPPPPPTSLSADAVRDTEIDISWTDDSLPDTDPATAYRVFISRDGGATETQVATLGASATTYTLVNLKNGEEYRIVVEAVNSAATRRDWRGFTTAPGATRTVGATETVTRDSAYENGGVVENRGEINVTTDFEL